MLVVLEDHVRRLVMVTAGALAKGPGDEEEEHRHHDDQPPAIGEMSHLVIAHRTAPEVTAGTCACSCGAAFSTSTSVPRSEEHTSELQSLMRISYAVFCLKKKTKKRTDVTGTVHRHHKKQP